MNDDTALVVVDMQWDFYNPFGGTLYVAEGEKLIGPIVQYAEQFKTVVLTKDWHPENHVSFKVRGGQWPAHCVAGSIGASMPPMIGNMPNVVAVVQKGTDPNVDSYSAFFENRDAKGYRKPTGLQDLLFARGVRKIHIVGLARDFCVLWTAQDAALGLNPHVVWDLTRAVFPEKDNETRELLAHAGAKVI
jgi:nicotinamidase/pyrazinamidase